MLALTQILDMLNKSAVPTPACVRKWREVYYGMSLHIDGACPHFKNVRDGGTVYPKNYFGPHYQHLFETYLFNRHPRENEYTRQWRLSQYRPVQKEPFHQVMQVITGAVFQDSGYGITIDDKEDSDYIWGSNFQGHDLPGYIAANFQNICNDPNGIFVAIPAEPWYATTTRKIAPQIHFIPSKQILLPTCDELIFELDEYVWCINAIGYFRFVKQADGSYANADAGKGYYAHLLGRMPIHKAGGLWNSQGFYDSWLDAAKAVADDYAAEKTNLQLVNKEASHPFIIEASEECPECSGNGKRQYCKTCAHTAEECECSSHIAELRSCRRCGGTGQISHNPGDRMIAPKEDMAYQLIQIVNPDVKVNQYHSQNVKDIFQSLLRSLHLHHVEEAQSAVAKDKDMETRYQFILRISNDLFDRLITGLLTDILAMRNVTTHNGITTPTASKFTITKPTQFQIKTSADLLAELEAGTKAQLPAYQRAVLLEDYVDKQWGSNEVLKKKTFLINRLDKLSLLSSAEKEIVVRNGAATIADWQYSLKLPGRIDELVREKGVEWFLGSGVEDVEKAL